MQQLRRQVASLSTGTLRRGQARSPPVVRISCRGSPESTRALSQVARDSPACPVPGRAGPCLGSAESESPKSAACQSVPCLTVAAAGAPAARVSQGLFSGRLSHG